MSNKQIKIPMDMILKVQGLSEYKANVDAYLDPEIPIEELAELFKEAVLNLVSQMDYKFLVEEILKLERGEPSLFQEGFSFNGTLH